MRVIIADDSNLIRERLQKMLLSFSEVELVGSYSNGSEALQALQTLQPDLAIVDLKMPGMSGLDVLSAIRKENKTLQFILLTFHSSDFYRQKAIEAGTDYFFSKVDDFDQVELVISKILNVQLN